MSYNAKNYTEQGGERTVIGGVLEIVEGGQIIGLPKCEEVEDSTATTVAALKDDFNALLGALKEAGYMESES